MIAAILNAILQITPRPSTNFVQMCDEICNSKIDDGGRIDDKKTESEKSVKYVGAIIIKNSINFYRLKAWTAFICLWTIFTKARILHNFDLECHIRIETNASAFAINGILSQFLLSNDYVMHNQNPLYPNLSSKNSK